MNFTQNHCWWPKCRMTLTNLHFRSSYIYGIYVKEIAFTLSQNRRKKDFHSRIIGLKLEYIDHILAVHIATLAMWNIKSLQRVTIRCSIPFHGSEAKLIRLIKKRIEEHADGLFSLDDISFISFIYCLRKSSCVIRYIRYHYTSRQHIAFKKLYPCCLEWFSD